MAAAERTSQWRRGVATFHRTALLPLLSPFFLFFVYVLLQ